MQCSEIRAPILGGKLTNIYMLWFYCHHSEITLRKNCLVRYFGGFLWGAWSQDYN